MCGIVGFTGKEQAAPILLDGLSKLEYRGYDSAGIAVRDGDKNSHSNKDNNNYEKTIRRFQEHENTLYDLVKNICDVNDQNIYTRKVFVHFNRFYLRLANEYGMKSEVKIYYNKLKAVGENGIKQKIYYIMGMLGIKAR